jgi:outer membrane protein
MLHRSKIGSGVAVAICALALSAAPAAFAQDQIKIGVVNLDQVLVESNVGKALQTKLDQFTSGVQTEGEAKTETALQLRQQIADGANTLSEEKLAELQQQYEAAATEIQRFRDDKQREGQKMQQEGLADIEQRLEPVFKAIRDEGSYDLILNYAPGVVVMLSDRIDITAQVVERLNSSTAN